MSSKSEKERQKQIQEKCQMILSQLLRDEDNKYCVDCDAKGPRWASWNLGIFLCIRCAGIHRNLGVHISKVKSVNLDTWTPEQIACLQQMGNSRARAVYEANLPDNFRRPQTDSSLEAFIRAKYEQKKYIAKEWVPPPMPKPSIEFEEVDKKKVKEKKINKSGLEVPLPTPSSIKKISSPSGSSSEVKDSSKEKPTSGAIDLLGLNAPSPTSADDPFGGFLSAESSSSAIPVSSSQSTSTTSNSDSSKQQNGQTNSEQESLFAQLSAEDGMQKKQQPLSNESILSLYSQTPAVQQPPQMLGIPVGAVFAGQQPMMFGSPAVPVGSVCYNAVPPMGTNMMSGMPPMMTAVPLQQQMGSLSLGTTAYVGVAPQAANSAMSWTGQQPGQTLSTNLWQ